MHKATLLIFACLLFGGCADSAREEKPTTDDATAGELAAQPATAESVSGKALADTSNDATILLASTLERAKAADKRVMVHLGAPW